MEQEFKWHTKQHLTTAINQTYYQNNSEIDGADAISLCHNSWFESGGPIVLLIALYCVVVFGGVFGNASLIITLCTQTSARFRNPLLVALCLADLLVTGVSAPLTIVAIALTYQTWPLPIIMCKSIYFMQSMPVAASTISLLMLSLDRYATVKHPRLAQLRERRFLPIVLAFCAWFSAIVLCIPILLAYSITSTTSPPLTLPNEPNAAVKFRKMLSCKPDYGSAQLHIWFIIIYTLFVFAFPGVGVILNHLGVRKKLCALSLTARAAHGELPLPMPILRRPTHMIIVTGMANAGRGVVDTNDDDSSDEENNLGENKCMMEARMRCNPRTPRSIRRGQNSQTKAKEHRVPSSELPLPQTSTLRSRRRLANMLVAAAVIFVGCWSPHVICFLCFELGTTNVCPKVVSEFSLLLGYAHSALSPILYWILNHNSLRQSTCAPFLRLSSVQKFLRTRLRVPAAPPPPSSTNEAALGPFNPRYIKARPQHYRPPASSVNLY